MPPPIRRTATPMVIQEPLRTTSLLTSNSATITSNSRLSMVNAGASTSAVIYSPVFGPPSHLTHYHHRRTLHLSMYVIHVVRLFPRKVI
ncbi:hypothetical protein JTE90_029270 [Oedothorax gibbosus]|uniref:Uncharacterized protein n=1 Tax=Oedothorax gibbosus TaxID=931172 RepID=A0AAV6TWP9_9ARAC|nr:hypothetical protein JTE90_029270 [Oedothorax gibbosus]